MKVIEINASRARIGKQYSDEAFVLRATLPADQVDTMIAAGPARRSHDPKTKPVLDLIRDVTARKGLGAVKSGKPGFKPKRFALTLRQV